MLVSVIVPCFNESAVIEATLERLAQVMEGCGHGADEFYQEEILEIVADFIHEREKK